MIIDDTTRVKDYLNKTKLSYLDYVINPYVGCPNNCLYCYASYMSSFSKHTEAWGEFVDAKLTRKRINLYKIWHKKVMISTVTDPYNAYEEKYGITRKIMEQLVRADAYITVMTKSKLVLRDLDLLKNIKNLEVAISISILDDNLKEKIEPLSSSVKERIETLKALKDNKIKTIVFIAPVIPEITDFRKIIEATHEYTDEYWFDKLTLRNSFKTKMFKFITEDCPSYKSIFDDIYNKKNSQYFENLADEIEKYCTENKIKYKNFYAGT